MSHELKRQYLEAIRVRYRQSSQSQKSLILDEFCAVCGYARKYAIAALNGRIEPALGRKPRGRTTLYGPEVVFHLVRLWRAMNEPGSTKFRAALPEWIAYDEHPALREDPLLHERLLRVSRPQLDRLLRPYRLGPQTGLSATRAASRAKRIKSQIPIEPKDFNVTDPGQKAQGDTVAHCGDRLEGTFVNSLTVTDLHSSWTEVRALWGKSSARVIEAMRSIEANLPFRLRGFQSDSGSEFMNHELLAYFRENRPEIPVNFTRSRPYKKDDNCFVEQKNYTHVREIFGYVRLDQPEYVALMNEIYEHYWCPLQNFFLPTQKLLRKTRVGARIRKEYEPARTPYRRLMESAALPDEFKRQLQERKANLNPFALQKGLKRKLDEFEALVRQRSTGLLDHVSSLPEAA